MKFLFTLLLSLPLFCFAQQKQYTYCCAGNVNTGADYFGIDKSSSDSSTGTITIDRKQITIDGHTYTIRKKIKHNLFKTNKGFIKLVYNKGALAQVQMLQYNTRYYYHILPGGNLTASR